VGGKGHRSYRFLELVADRRELRDVGDHLDPRLDQLDERGGAVGDVRRQLERRVERRETALLVLEQLGLDRVEGGEMGDGAARAPQLRDDLIRDRRPGGLVHAASSGRRAIGVAWRFGKAGPEGGRRAALG
jgi:hypothetical protein